MHPLITIFCPFTRRWAVDAWLEGLSKVEHDPALTNLCIIVDADEPYVETATRRFAKEKGYRSFHCKVNHNHLPNEINLSLRRQRVAHVHNQSKDLINLTDGEIIIGLEDDTVMDRMPSFQRLYQPLIDSEFVGFVEGVQVGRWGASIIGAWVADNIKDPTMIKTILPGSDYQQITGGGMYGYATRRHLYLNHEYYSASSQPYGPDVNYGFYVCQQGYTCYIDWQTVFGHNDNGAIMYPDNAKIRLAQVVFNKNLSTGKWDRTDNEPTRY